MMKITAAQVKELRDRTGLGMMDCKKALQAAEGNVNKAIEELRKSGLAKAAKKASRTAAEGLVLVKINDEANYAVMLEVNSETDFVARDANFRAFAEILVDTALAKRIDRVEALMALPDPDDSNKTLEDRRNALVAKVGENIQVRRLVMMTADAGTFLGSYTHADRIAVLIHLTKNDPELAKSLAMHIVASQPLGIDADQIDPAILAQERNIYLAQAKESGKPDDIIEKMVEGRIKKFLKEQSLIDQPFVKDPDQTIADLLKQAKATVLAFHRYAVGEGIEKETVDFRKEVEDQVKGSA